PLSLTVSAGDFEDQAYRQALARLGEHFSVGGGELYQFSLDVPARVILEFTIATLMAIPANLIAAALYDGLKHLHRPRRAEKTNFEFRIIETGAERTVEAYLSTSDDTHLQQALN